jgi:low affinity Fe/Cu permease
MKRTFSDLATTVDQLSGRPLAFIVALLLIATWALTGPLFHFSDTWQLIINTSTTIMAFLMVFVIQNTQNRDGTAIQAKLDDADQGDCSAKHLDWYRDAYPRGN